MTLAEQVVGKMTQNDAFSEWLGLELAEVGEGYCRLHYTVRPDMLNGFYILHGGVVMAASDSAFAFACSSHGRLSVALDVSVTFTLSARSGERLTVEAKERHLGNKTSVYDVATYNESGQIIAIFKGTAYRTGKEVLES